MNADLRVIGQSTSLVLWIERLSAMTWISRPGGWKATK